MIDIDEYADEEWVDDEDDTGDDLLTCPACRQAVHEDTQQCPHCGDWIIPVDTSGSWRRTAWIVAVVLVILSFTLMTVF